MLQAMNAPAVGYPLSASHTESRQQNAVRSAPMQAAARTFCTTSHLAEVLHRINWLQ